MGRESRAGHAAAAALVFASVAVGVAAAAPDSREGRRTEARRAVIGFINAFNRHDARAALAYFTTNPRFAKFVGANDCDFKRGLTVGYMRRAEVGRWLRQRAADHDQLTIASIRLLGARPAGAAVTYSRRVSDTLASLGFPAGIEPSSGTKIGFTTSGPVRLTQFANAGGFNRSCGP
jgi:hypothetical protein